MHTQNKGFRSLRLGLLSTRPRSEGLRFECSWETQIISLSHTENQCHMLSTLLQQQQNTFYVIAEGYRRF